MMKFSVIIPVYQVEKYLFQCIDSVLCQTYDEYEIILVDDGSTDNSPQICDDYAKSDPRIKVIHKENGGLSSARNAGLRVAEGEYVVFLDSDDYYLDNRFLEEAANTTEKTGCDAIFFQRVKFFENTATFDVAPKQYFDTDGKSSEEILLKLSESDLLDASAAMKVTKRDYLLKHNLFFKDAIFCEDIEWFFRYVVYLKKVCLMKMVPYCYRIRSGSISHSISLANVEDLFYSIECYAERIKNKNDIHKKVLLNYMLYQYSIVLGLSFCHLKKEERRKTLKRCKEYKWLVNYALSPKTKKVALLIKSFGLNIAAFILGIYIAKK